ncbi:MAG: hypothetical protein M1839_008481 [Geoglossum umbratile]|nr:MAG: hypothetical protein M1839_008481 [Geoglossum umbratile]
MAISKGIGGWFFNSQVLLADALHALTDLVSDFMTLATISWSLKPPTAKFPSGYGKIESLGSLGVSGILSGFIEPVRQVSTFGNERKIWIYKRYLEVLTRANAAIKIARERKSAVLASNAVHHRVDSLTSIVALLAIGGSHFIHNATWLDPVGGLIVSAMVIQAGWANTGAALMELADVGVDEEIKGKVAISAKRSLAPDPVRGAKGVVGGELVEVRRVQGVKAGQNYLMDIELAVPGDWPLQRVRGVEEAVRERVGRNVRGVRRVRVRFVPKDVSGDSDFTEFIAADRSPRGSPELEMDEDNGHDLGHRRENGHEKKSGE